MTRSPAVTAAIDWMNKTTKGGVPIPIDAVTTAGFVEMSGRLMAYIATLEAQPSPAAEKVMEEIYWANTIEDPTLDQFRPAILPILTRYAAAVRAQAWQPIDTAPKDGTIVLAAIKAIKSSDTWMDTTWYSDIHNSWMYGSEPFFSSRPTHWQPLPLPPTQGGE